MQLIEILVNWGINKRKTIIALKNLGIDYLIKQVFSFFIQFKLQCQEVNRRWI